MNKTFRLIWNIASGVSAFISELVRLLGNKKISLTSINEETPDYLLGTLQLSATTLTELHTGRQVVVDLAGDLS